MLWNLETLRGYRLLATDDTLGRVSDVYFDDEAWTVRYVVVDTARWLPGRKVLISPQACGHPDAGRGEVPVSLTARQVEESPPVSADQPVARQQEAALHSHYGWTPYWLPAVAAGATLRPEQTPEGAAEAGRGDPHLRSGREVEGYAIAASDGHIGEVADLQIDEDGWVIRYLVIDTRKWLPGRKVLIAPDWVEAIDWSHRDVRVSVTKQKVKDSPEYNPKARVERGYETLLYGYYGMPPYWVSEPRGVRRERRPL